jgi:hypothetical protein
MKVDGPIEAGKKIPLLDIGSGVYPSTIFFNHSCAPNTVRINQGTRVSYLYHSAFKVWCKTSEESARWHRPCNKCKQYALFDTLLFHR